MKLKITIIFLLFFKIVNSQTNLPDTSWYQLIFIDTTELNNKGYDLNYYEFKKDSIVYQVLSDLKIEKNDSCYKTLKIGCFYQLQLNCARIYDFIKPDTTTFYIGCNINYIIEINKYCITIGGRNKSLYKSDAIRNNNILCSVKSKNGKYDDFEKMNKCKKSKKLNRKDNIKRFIRHPLKSICFWF